jgi:hypothetical protein
MNTQELAVKLHQTMDASVWAYEFCKRNPAVDEGTALGWFANAIMVGFDHGVAKTKAQQNEVMHIQH